MKMDKQEEQTYQPQEARILQGSAQGSSIVPAGLASSSDNGLSPTLPASGGPEHAIVEESQGEGRTDSLVPKLPVTEKAEIKQNKDVTIEMVSKKEIDGGGSTLPEKLHCMGDMDMETASNVSGGTAMECDEIRATKRKKLHSVDRYSTEESEDEALKRVKVLRKQKIITDEPTSSHMLKNQSRSDSDLSIRPSEEDMRIVEMKKGYISKQKRLEIEEAKEEIALERAERNRRKMEERIRVEEERRKKEERIKAESNILAKISVRPEKEYIGNMTASDLAAMALEYLEHVDTIRTKCGTMQGALSGELKRRKISLDNMVKALQAKAEENGDPVFLKAKIDELIKKNREEEKKKTKEINELKELVNDLMKENKEMKKELKLIKEDMKRRNRKQDETTEKKEESKEESYKKKKETYTYQNDEARVWKETSTSSMDDGPVMRPLLKGRSTPIPNSNLKQRNEINKIREKKEENKKKIYINIKVKENIQIKPPRIKENIQIKPPRRGERITDNIKEGINQEEEVDMEWEENGTDWNEEVHRDNENIQDRNTEDKNSQEKENIQIEIVEKVERTKEGMWTEVVKKGERRKKLQEEKKNEMMNKRNVEKRKLPRTAAVCIKGDVKQGFSYAEALRKARTQIKMDDLHIDAPQIWKGSTGPRSLRSLAPIVVIRLDN